MKRKELFWMLVPCLFWLLSTAQSQPLIIAQPFQIVIEKIEVRPVSPKEVSDGYDTQVVVTLNQVGPVPSWWKARFKSSAAIYGKAKLFYESEGRQEAVPTLSLSFRDDVLAWTPAWNDKTAHYEARYFMRLSRLPQHAGETVLRGEISCADFGGRPAQEIVCPSMPFSFVVRHSNQVITPPQVSHDPMIEIRCVEIEKFAPEKAAREKYDTKVRVYWKNKGFATDSISSFDGMELLDNAGKTVLFPKNTLPDFAWAASSGDSGAYYSLRLNAIPATEPDITLQSTHSLYGRWPLQISIPLRQNGKDLKGRLNKKQFRFEPLSIKESR